ncbi:MAG: LptF/LptG family permease [Desulfobulbaceae bacterium]|nr:LptF/LptG family permease [Candidatus Kapabacteria bacterium]MBS4001443.1 LptF/LptG family permease [Desulfobulbaceae bacterium]
MKIIDRYIIKQFIFTFIFAQAALSMIFVVIDLMSNLDKFLDQNASVEVIASYYFYFMPEIIKMLTPIASLLSTLFTMGRMSTLNEITAMKSGGVSLYRIMLPFVTMAILISFAHLYFNGWVVPESNKQKHDISNKYFSTSNSNAPIYNLYFREGPTVNLLMQHYDSDIKSGSRIAIEYFTDEVTPRLSRRIESNIILWDEVKQKWMMKQVIERIYSGNNVNTIKHDSLEITLNITDSKIAKLKKSPDEMNFDELAEFIEILQSGGRNVRELQIDYHGQFAFPFANFIVILFGVPFASVRRKGGIAIQIGAALVISFFYIIFLKVSQPLAQTMDIQPIVAGWMANMIFFVAGIIVIFKTKT